jgi:hypothetical protein
LKAADKCRTEEALRTLCAKNNVVDIPLSIILKCQDFKENLKHKNFKTVNEFKCFCKDDGIVINGKDDLELIKSELVLWDLENASLTSMKSFINQFYSIQELVLCVRQPESLNFSIINHIRLLLKEIKGNGCLQDADKLELLKIIHQNIVSAETSVKGIYGNEAYPRSYYSLYGLCLNKFFIRLLQDVQFSTDIVQGYEKWTRNLLPEGKK